MTEPAPMAATTNLAAPVAYRKTIVDSVQLTGWTPDTVERALSTLSDLCAAHPHALTDDNVQLATELTRWLRCAAEEYPRSLVEYLDEMQPLGEHESPWGKLECLLARDEPLEVTICALQERYQDPTPFMRILLDERVKPGSPCCDLERHYQRAVEVLLALGTRESLTYLLAHMDLLCWDDSKLFRELVQTHWTCFTEVALDAWPRLDWIDRTHLIEIYKECELDAGPLHALLFTVDTGSMEYELLGRYIDTLAACQDPCVAPLIQQLITRALDDIQRQPNQKADRFTRYASHVLITEMELPIDPKLRTRAAQLGIRW